MERKDLEILTTKQAVIKWGISRKALFALVRDGKLRPITNLGKEWRFLASDFNESIFIRL